MINKKRQIENIFYIIYLFKKEIFEMFHKRYTNREITSVNIFEDYFNSYHGF